MNTEQKPYEVKIHEKELVWDNGQGRVIKTLCHKRFNDESVATSPLIAVYKAIKSCEKEVKDLDMIEVKVDNCPFPG